MCGICGYAHFDRTKRPSEDILRRMTDTLAHRGPDDSGLVVRGPVALGHRRLAIIDLTTGHQPMANEDGSIVIVYNGEIYNFQELKTSLRAAGHAFTTHSDTEVVIHAYEEYGEACLERFNGMFAFALWDARRERLFLARDRFGKKPLYYGIFDNQFVFASELKALLKHPAVRKEIDLGSLSKYLAYEYVPSPHSIFKNIRKLPAASKLTVRLDGSGSNDLRPERYWRLYGRRAVGMRFDPAYAAERLADLLKEAVRKRLVSDVPLGVFLSGGIDSSSVVAMMAELVEPKSIKTFSIGFRERSFDESGDARAVADHFKTDHYEEIVSPHRMLEVFPAVAGMLDEPFADSSIIPTYIVSAFARTQVTVALGGDGGDELFLGYPSFIAHKLAAYLRILPPRLARSLVAAAVRMLPVSHEYTSLIFRAQRFLRGLTFPESVRHQAWIGSFLPQEQRGIFLPHEALSYDPDTVYETTRAFFDEAGGLAPLDRASAVYCSTYLTDDILTKVDRASMMRSLEVRAPFLDTDLAEFAATIPAQFKLRGLTTKWILKQAMRTRLPPAVLAKRKQGFAVPVAQWLKTDLKGLLLETFEKSKIEREGIFDYNYIHQMIEAFLADERDTRKEIWALFMFEMWYDRWMG